VSGLALELPAADLEALRFKVKKLTDDRPGTYRMLDASGRILYVGKAKALRTRLLSYFRAKYPGDKAARILHATADIQFEPAPSEFAAALSELTQIRAHRPTFNVAMNRTKRHGFVVLTDEVAPRLIATSSPERHLGRTYGPLPSPTRLKEAVRTLNDLLGMRDCRADMPVHYAEQGELFAEPRRAACPRFDFGSCAGPCAGLVSETEYRSRGEFAAAFLEGRTVSPIGKTIAEMQARSDAGDFERALHWRQKFEALEWLIASVARARVGEDALSFVYREPGDRGAAMAYLIIRGEIRAVYPDPVTPIEREAFEGVVRDQLALDQPEVGRVEPERLHQRLLVASWFRTHPDAWRRTTPLSN
jgi:excinuclease ABC subunit C